MKVGWPWLATTTGIPYFRPSFMSLGRLRPWPGGAPLEDDAQAQGSVLRPAEHLAVDLPQHERCSSELHGFQREMAEVYDRPAAPYSFNVSTGSSANSPKSVSGRMRALAFLTLASRSASSTAAANCAIAGTPLAVVCLLKGLKHVAALDVARIAHVVDDLCNLPGRLVDPR